MVNAITHFNRLQDAIQKQTKPVLECLNLLHETVQKVLVLAPETKDPIGRAREIVSLSIKETNEIIEKFKKMNEGNKPLSKQALAEIEAMKEDSKLSMKIMLNMCKPLLAEFQDKQKQLEKAHINIEAVPFIQAQLNRTRIEPE